MSVFTLQQEGHTVSTSIPNNFIENYMPTAAGEFVKIYIYLLKCISQNCSELSISMLSDVFNNTEKDTTRALKYWEKKGLLKLSFNESGELTALTLISADQASSPAGGATAITRTPKEQPETDETTLQPSQSIQETPVIDTEDAPVNKIAQPRQYSRNEIAAFAKKDSYDELVLVFQRLLERNITSSDVNVLMFMEDALSFPDDLIEYLIEYCATVRKKKLEQGKSGNITSRYIEKTAIAWAEQGIKDVRGAKLINAIYSDNCFPIMKAFGLTGRMPALEEYKYIDKWVLSYGFNQDMILEAVNRTINQIHQPSFEYADSILKKWKAAGIATLNDVKKADEQFKTKMSKASKTAAEKAAKKAASTSFMQFEQRDYDDDFYRQLEEKLTNK